jgi:hypothetical protein
MAIVAYLTHPMGEDDAQVGGLDLGARGDHIANAMQWFKFMVMTTKWCITCPWFVYIAAVDDVFHRPRALRDQVELIGRSDLVVMCGGRISPHMEIEKNLAQRRIGDPLPVLDLTGLGITPPWDRLDVVGQDIVRLAKSLGL